MSSTVEHVADAAVRVGAPLPIAVTGLSLYGISMQDVVYVLTAALTLLMIAEKLWSLSRKWRRRRDEASDE
jgi:hypothetical protein